MEETNVALKSEKKYRSHIEEAQDYIEHFDILETITNVGNDEVFTPKKVCAQMLDSLPDEVWHHPEYKWLNPCSKNGIFEREIALRLDEGLKDIIPDELTRRKHILQEMIFSIGLTKFTSEVARRTLYYCNQANRKCDGIKGEDGHFVNGYAIGNGTWFDTAEGNVKTPTADHVFEKDRCKFCGILSDSKYVKDPIQNEKYAYEFIHHSSDDLRQYLADKFFKGDITKMHFDIIIGNPPYQLSTNKNDGNENQAKPIYNLFIEQSLELNPTLFSMIIPSRWFSGGMGLDEFREKMRNNRHLEKIVDYLNAKECFPSSSISGGVCYFLINRNYTGDCEFTYVHNGTRVTQKKDLREYNLIIRFKEAYDIIKKIKEKKVPFLSSIVSSVSPFGLNSNIRGSKEKSKNDVSLYTKDGISYLSIDKVQKGQEMIGKYKVMISNLTAEHANEPDRNGKYKILSTMRVLYPGEICNFSYLILGPFNTKEEADNLISLLKTKFTRFMLMISVSSIHLSKDKFQFVPFLPLNESWSDEKMNNYFGLSKEEADFISSLIKEY